MNDGMGRDAVRLTIAKVFTMVIGLVTAMLLSHFRTLEEYGSFSQVQTVVNLVVALFVLGLPNSVSYFLVRAETGDEKREFLSNYLTLSTAISLVVGVLIYLATPLIERYYDNAYLSTLAFVFALLPWVNITFGGFDNIMVVYHRTRLLMVFKIIMSVFLLMPILIVEWLGWTFHTYMILYLGVQAAFAVAIYVIVAQASGGVRPRISGTLLKRVLVFSVPLGLASVVGTWNIELGKLVVGRLMTTDALAIYSNASRELPITLITASMTAVLMPRIVHRAKEARYGDAVGLWGDATVISYYVVCFFAAACIVAAPQMMAFLYSDKYLPGVPVFQVYGVVLLMRTTYFGMILNAIGKTKLVFASSVLALVLNVALSIPFFYLFGMIGPAIAALVSIMATGVFQLFFTGRDIKVGFARIMPWRALGGVTAINVGLGAAAFGAMRLLGVGTGWVDLAKTMAIGCVWFGVYALVISKSFRVRWTRMNVVD